MTSVLGFPLPTTIFGPASAPRPEPAPARIGRAKTRFDAVIIGAGFSGLGMAIRLKREGVDGFVVLERASDVGGTWWHNTYPGCRCDTPSRLYSFAFAPNPEWTETYARQPEIQAYLRRVAEEEGVLPHIRFGTDVTGADWDEKAKAWRVRTSSGTFTTTCLIGATGPLSEPKIPDFPGRDSFAGPAFHSARWDHDVDLTGKRVAVIGTGASAVQIVPEIAPIVAQLDVYQRSPAWVPPHTGRRTGALERAVYGRVPAAQRLPRASVYYASELYVLGWTRWREATLLAEAACRAHLLRQVRDPEVRRKLSPDYRLGCKRPTPSNTFYPTFNRENVELVTDGIAEIRPDSIVTTDGIERPVDVIVYATGFHVTDTPAGKFVRGRDGKTLDEVWQGSPNAYLGSTVHGFPNLFLLLGPNTGNLTTSVVLMVESQIEYVLSCLRTLREQSLATIEVRREAQDAFTAEVQAKSAGSVWLTGGCESWYLDRNGTNSTLWPDFSWRFDALTGTFAAADHVLTAQEGHSVINEHIITVAGTRTRLLEVDGDGPTVVLIHGVTDCAEFYEPALRHFAEAGQRAVAVDLPGFGKAQPLLPGDVLPQLDAFLDALIVKLSARGRPIVLVGHSMGGALALRLAQRSPDDVLGYVAAPPSGLDLTALHTLGTRLPLAPTFAGLNLMPGQLRREFIKQFWKTIAVGDRSAPTPQFLDAYAGYFDAAFTRYLGVAQRVLRELRGAVDASAVRAPLLLIWGEKDLLANPKGARSVLETVPGSRLVTLPGVGHCPAVERPEEFARAVLQFTADLPRPTVRTA